MIPKNITPEDIKLDGEKLLRRLYTEVEWHRNSMEKNRELFGEESRQFETSRQQMQSIQGVINLMRFGIQH